MLKYRFYALFCVYIVFLIIDWNISNLPLIKMGTDEIISREEVFISFFDPTNGYSGMLQILVIYGIILLLSFDFVQGKESPAFIIRFKGRKAFKRNEILKIFLVALSFSTLHEVINLIFIVINLNGFTVPFRYSLFTIGILTLFYTQMGIISQIVWDLTKNKTLGVLIPLFLTFIEFLMWKYFIPDIYMPYMDLLLPFQLICGSVHVFEILISLLRYIFLTLLLYFISQKVFSKKDILEKERIIL